MNAQHKRVKGYKPIVWFTLHHFIPVKKPHGEIHEDDAEAINKQADWYLDRQHGELESMADSQEWGFR